MMPPPGSIARSIGSSKAVDPLGLECVTRSCAHRSTGDADHAAGPPERTRIGDQDVTVGLDRDARRIDDLVDPFGLELRDTVVRAPVDGFTRITPPDPPTR